MAAFVWDMMPYTWPVIQRNTVASILWFSPEEGYHTFLQNFSNTLQTTRHHIQEYHTVLIFTALRPITLTYINTFQHRTLSHRIRMNFCVPHIN
jgi:chloramphenicol O-acetyltransferase